MRLRTPLNLAGLKIGVKLIAAGTLHDASEETSLLKEDLANAFGEQICSWMRGVTKIGKAHYRQKDFIQAEDLRNFFLAINKGPEVAFIKLTDQLDNMRTLGYLPKDKIQRIALETDHIYVPLAQRLGIEKWAIELSDLAFKYLKPKEYHWITQQTHHIMEKGKEYLEKIKSQLEKEITQRGVKLISIDYRVKSPSSRKEGDLRKIYDLLALRIITKEVKECYTVLSIIHSLFQTLHQEFDDYIASPKPNGYRSLRTTCIGTDGNFIEFQIKT